MPKHIVRTPNGEQLEKYSYRVEVGGNCEHCGDSTLLASDFEEAWKSKLSPLLLHHVKAHFDNTLTIFLKSNDKPQEEVENLLKTFIQTDLKLTLFKSEQEQLEKEKKDQKHSLIRGILGLALGVFFVIICSLGAAIPAVAMYVLLALGTIAALILGIKTYIGALKEIKERNPGMNLLFSLSTLTAIVTSLISPIVSGLSMMLDAALMVLGIQAIGNVIENTAKKKLLQRVRFKDPTLQEVTVINEHDNSEQLIDIDLIEPGTLIFIKKGQLIPLDGLCESKDAKISSSNFTGQPLIKKIEIGTEVLAGSICESESGMRLKTGDIKQASANQNLDGYIVASTKRKEERLAQIQQQQQKKMGRLFTGFILGILGIALITGICVGLFFPPILAIQCVIAILVAACPCILGFIIPITQKIALKKAEKHGISFNRETTLQTLKDVTSVFIDLNGTLTKHEFTASNVSILDDTFKENQGQKFWQIIYSIESKSSHPIAQELTRISKIHLGEHAEAIEIDNNNLDLTQRSGISATIQNQRFAIGNESYIKDLLPESELQKISEIAKDSPRLTYIIRDGELVGYFNLIDELRPNALFVIKKLKKLFGEKKVGLLTGSDKNTALYYAKKLGLSIVHAKQTPKTKRDLIEEQQAKGENTLVIGDSGNDAPAMAEAFASIAIDSTHAHAATQSNADIVIRGTENGNPLLSILTALRLGKLAEKKVKQNLAFSFSYNFAIVAVSIGLLIALSFTLNPAIGVALMVAETLLILGNAFLLLNKKFRHQDAHYQQKISEQITTESESPVSSSIQICSALRDCKAASHTHSHKHNKDHSHGNVFTQPSGEGNRHVLSTVLLKPMN